MAMALSRPIGVALVDAEAMLVDALSGAIESAGDMRLVMSADRGAKLLADLPAVDFDVCVVSTSLPDLDGFEILRRLKLLRDRSPRVILWSSHLDPWLARRAIQAGADGFIAKDEHVGSLLQAIRTVASGSVYLAANIAGILLTEPGENRIMHEALSPRETEIFMLIARGHSTSEIAAETHLDQRTVSTYRRRVLDKLGMSRNADIVSYAIRHGLIE